MKPFWLRLKWRISGDRFGSFVSWKKGSGIEINDIRNYIPGDSSKHINWKLSAKYDKLFVDVFHMERELLLDVFLDINGNRQDGVETPTRDLIAEYLHELFAFAQKNSLQITLWYPLWVTFGEYTLDSVILRRENYGTAIHDALYSQNIFPPRYYSNLESFIAQTEKNTKKRALLMISDFLWLSEKMKTKIHFLEKLHSVHQVTIPLDLRYLLYQEPRSLKTISP